MTIAGPLLCQCTLKEDHSALELLSVRVVRSNSVGDRGDISPSLCDQAQLRLFSCGASQLQSSPRFSTLPYRLLNNGTNGWARIAVPAQLPLCYGGLIKGNQCLLWTWVACYIQLRNAHLLVDLEYRYIKYYFFKRRNPCISGGCPSSEKRRGGERRVKYKLCCPWSDLYIARWQDMSRAVK